MGHLQNSILTALGYNGSYSRLRQMLEARRQCLCSLVPHKLRVKHPLPKLSLSRAPERDVSDANVDEGTLRHPTDHQR